MPSFKDNISNIIENAQSRESALDSSARSSAKQIADKARALVTAFAAHHEGNAPFEMSFDLVCHSNGHFFDITEGDHRRLTLFNDIFRVDTYRMSAYVKRMTELLRQELVPDGFTVSNWEYYSARYSYDDNDRHTAATGFDFYNPGRPMSAINININKDFTDIVRGYRGLNGNSYTHTYSQGGTEVAIDFRSMEPHPILHIRFRLG